MPIVSYSEILGRAKAEGYAVGCFNIVNDTTLYACLDTAEAQRSPIILAFSQGHLDYVNMPRLLKIMEMISADASVPVCIMLDHATEESVIDAALDCGVGAVMYDLSSQPFEKHIQRMRAMVEKCHARGVQVEGELGRHGSRWSGAQSGSFSSRQKTDPALLPRYIAETGVDGLAIYVGNNHSKFDPAAKLDLTLLDEIDALTDIPLVLHGSSGLDEEDVRVMVGHGVLKVNHYTDISRAGVHALREALAIPTWTDYHALPRFAESAMSKVVLAKLKVLGSTGRAQ